MRIIAIGLGGAGCRIVDSLYAMDRKSSRVACVQGLAVDVDENALNQLTTLPEEARLFFPAIDPMVSGRERGTENTVTIDIAEILSRIHNLESGETDAIFICMGLGGSMTDIAPHVITGLRSQIVEPIFGLVTLPCLAEGQKRSAKAADDIDILSPLLDGLILFDNETWYKKVKKLKRTLVRKEKSLLQHLGLAKEEPELSPEHATYQLLNERIVRRISLILRAGEFRADGGIDLAEVVLDSGEVLNTMKGMGFITIGYAVDHLPKNPLAFLSQFRPGGVFNEENKKKASRIVDLAKQAIYHEISTPCDMTSAHKALILIAGPSQELSMKGFMTVRKWIDRSIAGLETRSGDYPVVNTANVAIIIMLSGLENIPRISEIREIRDQHSSRRWSGTSPATPGAPAGPEGTRSTETFRDDMIVLPGTMKKATDAPLHPEDALVSPRQDPLRAEPVQKREQDIPTPAAKPVLNIERSPEPSRQAFRDIPGASPRHRVIVSKGMEKPPQTPAKPPRHHATPEPGTRYTTPEEKTLLERGGTPTGSKDSARLRIERELQKQRLKAMAGREAPKETARTISAEPEVSPEPSRKRRQISIKTAPPDTEDHGIRPEEVTEPEQKTVIIAKRKRSPLPEDSPGASTAGEEFRAERESPHLQEYSAEEPRDDDDQKIVMKDSGFVRAKDQVFAGSDVKKPLVAPAKDSPLIRTSLKSKKGSDHPKKDSSDPDEDST